MTLKRNMDKIKNICIQVGEELGKGYNECIYQEGISLLLRESHISYSKEVNLPVSMKDIIIGHVRADIVIPKESLIIECKAIDGNLKVSHIPQIIKYLKIMGYKNGLFVNFNQNPAKDTVELVEVSCNSYDVYKILFCNKTESNSVYYMNGKGMIIEN